LLSSYMRARHQQPHPVNCWCYPTSMLLFSDFFLKKEEKRETSWTPKILTAAAAAVAVAQRLAFIKVFGGKGNGKEMSNWTHSGGDELPNQTCTAPGFTTTTTVLPLLTTIKEGGKSKVLLKCRTKWKTVQLFFFFKSWLVGADETFSRSMGLYAHNGRV
jgi:hypothetical protein